MPQSYSDFMIWVDAKRRAQNTNKSLLSGIMEKDSLDGIKEGVTDHGIVHSTSKIRDPPSAPRHHQPLFSGCHMVWWIKLWNPLPIPRLPIVTSTEASHGLRIRESSLMVERLLSSCSTSPAQHSIFLFVCLSWKVVFRTSQPPLAGMALPNIWHHRKVAKTAARSCDICYKPSSSVLVTPDKRVSVAKHQLLCTDWVCFAKFFTFALPWFGGAGLTGFFLCLPYTSKGPWVLFADYRRGGDCGEEKKRGNGQGNRKSEARI
ncbi:mitochondrial Acyl-CoA Thioesterase [Histoplasma capsulatum]|uniref:Mitochondrial Acyl-CoA Thioesterase n=1 Tax=Ajellomyces capsulatus TaxID=5037 RepID=A0A8A1MCY7_AJECA|nr:mitochondrial Acyl-CoA Thioesterase [Histoplasma capsulatum]